MKVSKLEALVKSKLQTAVLKEGSIKVQVSLRLPVAAVAILDMSADLCGQTRTSLAAELLTAAIQDVAPQFGFAPMGSEEFMEQIRERVLDLLPEDATGPIEHFSSQETK